MLVLNPLLLKLQIILIHCNERNTTWNHISNCSSIILSGCLDEGYYYTVEEVCHHDLEGGHCLSDWNNPDFNVHGANMGPIWGRQDPGGPHVVPVNLVFWEAGTILNHKAVFSHFHRASLFEINMLVRSSNMIRPNAAFMSQRIRHLWFSLWLVAFAAPEHKLNQGWLIVSWTLRDKYNWNFDTNIYDNVSKTLQFCSWDFLGTWFNFNSRM